MRRRGLSERERRWLQLGRALDGLNEASQSALQVFFEATSGMDRTRCGECGGELGDEATLCAQLSPDRSAVLFMAMHPEHEAGAPVH